VTGTRYLAGTAETKLVPEIKRFGQGYQGLTKPWERGCVHSLNFYNFYLWNEFGFSRNQAGYVAGKSINCACLNGSHGKIAKNKFDRFTAKYTLRNKLPLRTCIR
jgi:hypothetical protein